MTACTVSPPPLSCFTSPLRSLLALLFSDPLLIFLHEGRWRRLQRQQFPPPPTYARCQSVLPVQTSGAKTLCASYAVSLAMRTPSSIANVSPPAHRPSISRMRESQRREEHIRVSEKREDTTREGKREVRREEKRDERSEKIYCEG